MNPKIAVIGGGAAGFFGAVTAAESNPSLRVTIFERSGRFLEKVRISGGGRCNVTHACFEQRELARFYPRGGKELISPFHQFNSVNTVEWFEKRGVRLKTEPDGRMFPTTDQSQTIIDCLTAAAHSAGIELRANTGVEKIANAGEKFLITLTNGSVVDADRVLISTGGCRSVALGSPAASLGHAIEPPVPSLFTFHIEVPWVKRLAGLSVPLVKVAVPGTNLSATGPLLFTHWGLSGPAVLKLSAWGARELHGLNYQFPLEINWIPGGMVEEGILATFRDLAQSGGARLVKNSPCFNLPSRLWEALLENASVDPAQRLAFFSKKLQLNMAGVLCRTQLAVSGKSLNKDEFVTCGGVRLSEINFKTMESRICSGLFFAGEVLDIDGLTGGFNFQNAWTTGWIAGRSIGAF